MQHGNGILIAILYIQRKTWSVQQPLSWAQSPGITYELWNVKSICWWLMLEYCYWWIRSGLLNTWSHHVCHRVLIFSHCHLKVNVRASCRLLSVSSILYQLDRWDADNHRIEIEHHLYCGSWTDFQSLFLRNHWKK